ncbi:3TM-type holin [Novosphingobium sp. Leaf2]|uniref:3TM-type holin n=1 Tax=Novosphingobium sp. Leaf2 TaxID=1735670 RepID=UPI0007012824|nr:3TM-type holin [Novosphingobium sp. Leaf2]KQM19390.1 hypothetical protein ASE49_03915 [Novosphingobium sp. Leaf2]
MTFFDSLVAPLLGIIDKVIPDPDARDQARVALMEMRGSHDVALLQARLAAVLVEGGSADPWTSRARPGFLYVMYLMILCALPMGVVAAFDPPLARAIGAGMNGYLAGIPEPLYALFGTGYLGYSAMRQWGKAKGTDR